MAPEAPQDHGDWLRARPGAHLARGWHGNSYRPPYRGGALEAPTERLDQSMEDPEFMDRTLSPPRPRAASWAVGHASPWGRMAHENGNVRSCAMWIRLALLAVMVALVAAPRGQIVTCPG